MSLPYSKLLKVVFIACYIQLNKITSLFYIDKFNPSVNLHIKIHSQISESRLDQNKTV